METSLALNQLKFRGSEMWDMLLTTQTDCLAVISISHTDQHNNDRETKQQLLSSPYN